MHLLALNSLTHTVLLRKNDRFPAFTSKAQQLPIISTAKSWLRINPQTEVNSEERRT